MNFFQNYGYSSGSTETFPVNPMASERERYLRAIAMLAFACKTLSYRGIYGN